MADLLVEIASNPRVRRLISKLRLPVPLPQRLARAHGPWEMRPFVDRIAVVGGSAPSALTPVVAKTLAAGGAETRVASGDAAPFRELGEAFGRPTAAIDLGALPDRFRTDIAIFDATAVEEPAALRALYDFFHVVVPALTPCAHVAVLGRAADEAASAASAAARGALDGFVRSLAKEVGRRGATAQLVLVRAGAEARVEPILRFVLSTRSAFVTGQTITVDTRTVDTRTADMRVAAPREPPLVKPLEHKVALVTGAGRGIGAVTARLLAREGAHVVCLDRPADESAAGQLARDLGGSVLAADVATDDAPAVIARHLREHHGGVDVVVHNAGIARDKTIARMTAKMWDQTIAVNLTAAPRVDELLLGDGLVRDGGRIICVASVVGIAGNAGQTNYAASKAGVIGYVRRRAAEVAARGISVNAVAPGLIETALSATMPRLVREGARRLSALGQGGVPSDVGEAITFLASPGAAGITGAVLRVCGGALLGA